MKLLYYPFFHTSVYPTACSAVAYIIDLAEKIARSHWMEDLRVDIVVPHTAKVDEVKNLHIRFIKLKRLSTQPGKGLSPVPEKWYRLLRNEYDYDLIIFCHASQLLTVKGSLFVRILNPMQFKMERPLAAIVSEPSDSCLQFPYTKWGQLVFANTPLVVPTATFTSHDRQYLIQTAKRFFDVNRVREVSRNITVLKPFVLKEALQSYKRNVLRNAKRGITFLHAGTLPTRKRVPLLVKAILEARKKFPNTRLLLITPWRRIPSGFNHPWIEVIRGANREVFFKNIKRADVFFCGPEYEGTGLSYVQMALAGLPGLFIKADWLAGRLPGGYPFIAPSEKLFPRYVLKVCEAAEKNPMFFKKAALNLSIFWEQMFSSRRTAYNWMSWFHNAILSYLPSSSAQPFWFDAMEYTSSRLRFKAHYHRKIIHRHLLKYLRPYGITSLDSFLPSYAFRALARKYHIIEHEGAWMKVPITYC